MSRKVDLDLQAKILLETIAIQKRREQIEANIRSLDALNQHRMETEASREISNFCARHVSTLDRTNFRQYDNGFQFEDGKDGMDMLREDRFINDDQRLTRQFPG
jgi:hypothetical protein